jgi:ribosomal protein S18 acetylase RimI-like enzyme
MPYDIRDAAREDLLSIAQLQAASWKAAYRGILPDAFLDGDLESDRKQRWVGIADRMATSDRLLIAMHGSAAAGFISGWTTDAIGCDAGFDLHIDNLHVRPDLRGQKLGVALMRELSRRQSSDEKVRAYLWVLAGNEPARRFYLRLGGRVSDTQETKIGGAVIGETRIVWDDFRSLQRV